MSREELLTFLIVNALIVHFPVILNWIHSIWLSLTAPLKYFVAKRDAAKSKVGDLPIRVNAEKDYRQRFNLSDSDEE